MYLCITVRFADPMFHGRSDGGTPEWPPSPLRLFQALVAAAAMRLGNPDQFRDYAAPAFEWLAGLHRPVILAPAGVTGVPFRMAVPNNDLDVVARDWARRVEPNRQPAELKTLKTVRPTYIKGGGEFPAVHYLWEIAEADRTACERHKDPLFAAARALVALGWGTDIAMADGRILSPDDADKLEGERWEPMGQDAVTKLRVPTPGAFDALLTRYKAFLSRIGKDGFIPVSPLSSFQIVGYRRSTDPAPRPFAAFELRTPDFERFQPFDPTRHSCAVAGMVRNALADLAREMRPFGWTDTEINTFVHGHTADGKCQARGPNADQRFAYVPLPSIERRGGTSAVVTAIRRVLVVGPTGYDREVGWARVLSGRELTPLDNRTPLAALRLIDRPVEALRKDPNLGPYIGEWRVWSTVTPLVLQGHDEADQPVLSRRLRMAEDDAARRRVREQAAARTERLLRRAFEQAGIPSELVSAASLEWRGGGFRAGVDLATRYFRPESYRFPQYHVQVRWPVPIQGPLVAGAARYRGLGIFAGE